MEKVKKSLVKKEYLVAEQAFPGGACHDEGSFCFDPGNDVHWLFHNGYPSRTFY